MNGTCGHSSRTAEVMVEREWPKAELNYLKQIGFIVRTSGSGHFSAVSFNPKTGECRGVMR